MLFRSVEPGGDGPLDHNSLAPSKVLPELSASTIEIPSVDWWITSRCNLACDFCYGPSASRRDPVGLREAILSAIEKCSAAVVTFCGGEPLLVRDIGRYARKLTDSGKRTILNTNGSLLQTRVCRGLDLAFAVVGLSIDGSSEAVHRAMRGAKADFDEVLRAAELVVKTPGMSLKLATVVSSVNRDDLPSLAALVRQLRPDIWRLYQYSSRGEQNTGQQRHSLSEDEFRSLAERAAALAAPVPTAPVSGAAAGCLIVDPEGNVLQPVGEYDYQRHGNCLEQSIDDIWAKMPSTAPIIENKRWLTVVTK
jgi:MoaA/NifB/PqqE/SkfB family radical SAM enzyme